MSSPKKNTTTNQDYASQFLEGSLWLIKKMVNSPGHALTFLTFLASSFNLTEARDSDRHNYNRHKLTLHPLTNPLGVTTGIAGSLEYIDHHSNTHDQFQDDEPNNPPVYKGPTTVQFPIGRPGVSDALPNYFIDKDNDSIVRYHKLDYLSLQNQIIFKSSPWIHVDPQTGNIKGHLSSGYDGNHTIYVTATDQRGAIGGKKLTITASSTRPNISFKPKRVYIGQVNKISMPQKDNDGNRIIIESVKTLDKNSSQPSKHIGLPSWATFEPESHKLSITPHKSGDQGFYRLIWTFKQCFTYLRDDTDANNCDRQPIKTSGDVTIPNRPPFVNNHFEDQVIYAFEQWRLSLAKHFEDRDGDKINYIIENKPDWLDYNAQSHMLEAYITQVFGFAQDHEVDIRAIDNYGGHAQAKLTLITKPLMDNLLEWLMISESQQPQFSPYQQFSDTNNKPQTANAQIPMQPFIDDHNQTEIDPKTGSTPSP